MAAASPSKATEKTPLITPPARVVLDDETSSVLRDRVTVRRAGPYCAVAQQPAGQPCMCAAWWVLG